jgi:hypothetical protein
MRTIELINGAKVLLNTETDVLLYDGRENTGPNQNRWVSLYAHAWKDHPDKVTFYLGHFSQWQGERCYISVISDDDARTFAIEHYGNASPGERSIMAEYDLFNESGFQ